MARVAVIGGGYGGLASAARLAKLGHEVTLLEAADHVGGALGFVEQDGFRWDAGPTRTLLPAVLRDLFRKSGRPVEKELELVPLAPVRQHRWEDDTVLDLPGGSRGDQIAAIDAALGAGLGQKWATYVDAFADDWEALRRDWLERPWSPDHASKQAAALLSTRLTMHKVVQKHFKDERLRDLATFDALLEGHDPRNVPAWVGMWSYVEQNLGAWTVPGGMGALAGALAARLETRGVTVLTSTPALDLEMSGERAVGVRTSEGVVEADHVVCAIDPRRLPALASYVERTMPAIPPVVCHVGIVGEVPPLPARGRAARRPVAGGPHRRHCSGGRTRVDAPGPRAHRRGHRHPPAACGDPDPRPGRGARRPVPPRPGAGVGRLAVRRAVAGAQHRDAPPRPAHPGPERADGRGPRDAGRRPALRRAVRLAGRPGAGPGVSRLRP